MHPTKGQQDARRGAQCNHGSNRPGLRSEHGGGPLGGRCLKCQWRSVGACAATGRSGCRARAGVPAARPPRRRVRGGVGHSATASAGGRGVNACPGGESGGNMSASSEGVGQCRLEREAPASLHSVQPWLAPGGISGAFVVGRLFCRLTESLNGTAAAGSLRDRGPRARTCQRRINTFLRALSRCLHSTRCRGALDQPG